jgi:hypothetical protein
MEDPLLKISKKLSKGKSLTKKENLLWVAFSISALYLIIKKLKKLKGLK